MIKYRKGWRSKVLRSAEEIKNEYNALTPDTGYVEVRPGIYEGKYTREQKRLYSEYIKTLPDDQQLAVWLHRRFCKKDHEFGDCMFYLEEHRLDFHWDGCEHRRWLAKAKRMLEISDIDTIKKLMIALVIS